MANDKKFMDIDTSNLAAMMTRIEKELGHDGLIKALRWTYRRVPGHVRKIMPKIVMKDYHVKSRYVSRTILKYRMTNEANGTSCIIPVVDQRTVAGGSQFTITSGTRRAANRRLHWSNAMKKKKPYIVKFNVKNGKVSELPPKMPTEKRSSYAGYPPFVTPKNSKANGLVFTRKFSFKSLPIIRVPSIGVPQMPRNESKNAMRQDIIRFMEKELEHSYEEIIRRIQQKAGSQ